MKTEHHSYCRKCGESILKQWKGWPHRDSVPMLPRILDGACEECGNVEGLESAQISWLNYHSEFSTGLPEYWMLVITSHHNKWGQPYYFESNCPRCNGRSTVSQMNYPNRTTETCHNCNQCGVIKTRSVIDKALHADELSMNTDVKPQGGDIHLEAILEDLQRQMAQTDLITEPRPQRSKSSGDFIEVLLAKRKGIKMKIYEEKGHAMPHIHIDYGRKNHAASFSVEPTDRIEGTLPSKYDRDIKAWISKNKEKLLKIWSTLQSGSDPKSLIAELQGDA